MSRRPGDAICPRAFSDLLRAGCAEPVFSREGQGEGPWRETPHPDCRTLCGRVGRLGQCRRGARRPREGEGGPALALPAECEDS